MRTHSSLVTQINVLALIRHLLQRSRNATSLPCGRYIGQGSKEPEGLLISEHAMCCCRDTMGRLLQRSGNATSLPYAFLPGNHEVLSHCRSPVLSYFTSNAPSTQDCCPFSIILVSCRSARMSMNDQAVT